MNNRNIIKLSEVDSTNNYALSLKGSVVFRHGLVVVSDFQTNGQGQRGSSWQSKKEKNLIISVVIEPKIFFENQFDISKIAALSVVDFLIGLGVSSMIKWPNDILVDNKKIAGILIQNVISKNMITHSVVGFGINVNQLIFDVFRPYATSLKLEMNCDFDLEELQNKLLFCLQNRIQDYYLEKPLDDDYLNLLFQKDKVSSFESKSKKFEGKIRGISNRGLLLIETDVLVKKFNLKEVRMIF